jgi:hypothetical protein
MAQTLIAQVKAEYTSHSGLSLAHLRTHASLFPSFLKPFPTSIPQTLSLPSRASWYPMDPPPSPSPHTILPNRYLLFEYIESSEHVSQDNLTPAIALSAARVFEGIMHAVGIVHDDIAKDKRGLRVVF